MDRKLKFEDHTIEQLLTMPPEELMDMASQRFRLRIPPTVDSVEDMQAIGLLLSQSASEYSYLLNMAMLAKLRKRQLKRDGAEKKECEDALSREEIFQNFASIMKTTYDAASRMITVKQQINEELRFTDGR